MISQSDFQNLKRGDELFLMGIYSHELFFRNFIIGDIFLFQLKKERIDGSNIIDIKHVRSEKYFWFSESTICECFETIQSRRDNKIENLLHENSTV